MDEREREVVARLDQLERKVDQVLMFTGQLEQLLGAFLAGGRGRLLAAAFKLRSGGDAR